MKSKTTLTSPILFKPEPPAERPLKSLRPLRSMHGIKSLRPKNAPAMVKEISAKH